MCLYDDVAFYLPNDRHAEQTVEEEPLVVSKVCHHDLQKVVRFTGYQIDGGYAEMAVADARFCFALPAAYSDVAAAPLLSLSRSARAAGT